VPAAAEVEALSWEEVEALGRGSSVVWRMWRGDPSINQFVDGWVVPRVRELYGIELRAVSGAGPEIVNQLLVEDGAGARGSADLVWINGETFHNLRSQELLWGPWAHRLPWMSAVDSASAILMRDFEQDPAGYEMPWGRVQFALIHDTLRTPEPPRTFEALGEWIVENPGRFTHDQSFSGVTFLKMLMYARGGGVQRFQGGFREEDYASGSAEVWEWVERHRSAFWRGGETFPAEVADLHRLFANGEVDFSMSNNSNEVITKVRQGILPASSRAFLLTDGTIANAHFLGIPANAPNPVGAMLVANFLLSPEAQLQKLDPDVWADGSVLDPSRLPAPWGERFREMERGAQAVPLRELERYAVPEVAPEYHLRLQAEWRERVRGAAVP
jgi:putative spermidine/putrescine transport system substrate-binding protein